MKNIILFLFSLVLGLTSCTKGADGLERVEGNSYTVEGTFLGAGDDVYGTVYGHYNQGANTLTLDLKWDNLPLTGGNSIVAFALVDETGNEIKKVSYQSTSVKDEFTIAFVGYNGLLIEQQNMLISNKLKLRICTQNDMGVTVEAQLNAGLAK